MKFSKATNYALHTMLFLISEAPDKPVGVQHLAEKQGVSPAYLSKILTKLVKSGLIDSVSGANGGYTLGAQRKDVSFLDVIHAIEGTASLFNCCLNGEKECLIQKVMVSAEKAMEEKLKMQKIVELDLGP
ncbi:Rrf2 family transcriptional regulator [Paenibacillus alkalitolerans]|uniref:Rrf2 family transcriptional regulator n=1 Tax=Paenibacillus alkalitolerans TaxID=2799335 RepID=UPI0018F50A2C|nr:RrF2 family transcriptional regulator [Paenibacillus alkalitolerans]